MTEGMDRQDSKASNGSWKSIREHIRASQATSTARRPSIAVSTTQAPYSDPYDPYHPGTRDADGHYEQAGYANPHPNANGYYAPHPGAESANYAQTGAGDPADVRYDEEGSLSDDDGYSRDHDYPDADMEEVIVEERDELDLSNRSPPPERWQNSKKRRFVGGFKFLKRIPKLVGRKKTSTMPADQRQSLFNEPKMPLSYVQPTTPRIRVTQVSSNGSPTRPTTKASTAMVPPPSTAPVTEVDFARASHDARSHYLPSQVDRSTSQRSRSHQSHNSIQTHTISMSMRSGPADTAHHGASSRGPSAHSSSDTPSSYPGPHNPPPSIVKRHSSSSTNASVITSPQMHLVQIARALRDFHHMPWHDPHHTTSVYVPEICSGRSKHRDHPVDHAEKNKVVKAIDQESPSWYRPSEEQRKKLQEKGKWPPPYIRKRTPEPLRAATAAGTRRPTEPSNQQPSMPAYHQTPSYVTRQPSQPNAMPRSMEGAYPMQQLWLVNGYGYPQFGPLFSPGYPSGGISPPATASARPTANGQPVQAPSRPPSVLSHGAIRPSNSLSRNSIRGPPQQNPFMFVGVPPGMNGPQSPPTYYPQMSPIPYSPLVPPLSNGVPPGFMPSMPQQPPSTNGQGS